MSPSATDMAASARSWAPSSVPCRYQSATSSAGITLAGIEATGGDLPRVRRQDGQLERRRQRPRRPRAATRARRRRRSRAGRPVRGGPRSSRAAAPPPRPIAGVGGFASAPHAASEPAASAAAASVRVLHVNIVTSTLRCYKRETGSPSALPAPERAPHLAPACGSQTKRYVAPLRMRTRHVCVPLATTKATGMLPVHARPAEMEVVGSGKRAAAHDDGHQAGADAGDPLPRG